MPPTATEVQFLIKTAFETDKETGMIKKAKKIFEKKMAPVLQNAVIGAEARVTNDIYYLDGNAVGDQIKIGDVDNSIRRRATDLMDSKDFWQKINNNLLATQTFTMHMTG